MSKLARAAFVLIGLLTVAGAVSTASAQDYHHHHRHHRPHHHHHYHGR